MITVFLNFFTTAKNIYMNIASFLLSHAGMPVVIKIILSLIVMVGLFFFIHYFWNFVSLVPLNVFNTYVIYQFTNSKLLVIALWITFFPWCLYIDDQDRRKFLFDSERNELNKLFRQVPAFWPFIINRVIRCVSMSVVTFLCYSLLYVYIVDFDMEAQLSSLYTVSFLFFAVCWGLASFWQSLNVFKNNSKFCFDDNITYFDAIQIQKKSNVSGDEAIALAFIREEKINFWFMISRIFVYVASFVVFVHYKMFYDTGYSGANAIYIMVFIFYILWCCAAKSTLKPYIKN